MNSMGQQEFPPPPPPVPNSDPYGRLRQIYVSQGRDFAQKVILDLIIGRGGGGGSGLHLIDP